MLLKLRNIDGQNMSPGCKTTGGPSEQGGLRLLDHSNRLITATMDKATTETKSEMKRQISSPFWTRAAKIGTAQI